MAIPIDRIATTIIDLLHTGDYTLTANEYGNMNVKMGERVAYLILSDGITYTGKNHVIEPYLGVIPTVQLEQIKEFARGD